jgi:hypothetical protein
VSLSGQFTIPAVALDASPGGLSADGSTLTLIHPRAGFPQRSTHLVVLDARRLSVGAQRITLHGDFSFDAISPNGSRLFLIHYLSRDPTNYAVRAFDTGTGRLIPGAIVDPSEQNPAEMRGFPLTRAMSPDGRWAYTLYTGSDKPFVHALNTSNGQAHCIDLPKLGGGSVYNDGMRMSPDGATAQIVSRSGQPLALINTDTLKASAPSPATPAATNSGSSSNGGGAPWLLIALGAGIAAGWLALAVHRRRREMPAAG